MIEFKAECGHTVRAKDDEAGSSVKCPYCARTANVPSSDDEPFDSLFDEVQRLEDPLAKPRKGGRRRNKNLTVKDRPTRTFNPFPIILRLCYAALLISIVIVVVRRFIVPLWTPETAPPPVVSATPETPGKRMRDGSAERSKPLDKGYINRGQLLGLFAVSTPPGATVYCVPATEAAPSGRIHRMSGCMRFDALSGPPPLADGVYHVELVLPWNHTDLKRYRGYTEFRRELERAPEHMRKQLVEGYFLPDEAAAVFFDPSEEQKYLVRQYRNVEIRNGRSAGVRGLFLPRIATADDRYSIEELVLNYLPEGVNYNFDERDVGEELEYYGVTEADQTWMLKALSRIGILPYMTQSRRIVVFKIGLDDGVLIAKVIRDSGK